MSLAWVFCMNSRIHKVPEIVQEYGNVFQLNTKFFSNMSSTILHTSMALIRVNRTSKFFFIAICLLTQDINIISRDQRLVNPIKFHSLLIFLDLFLKTKEIHNHFQICSHVHPFSYRFIGLKVTNEGIFFKNHGKMFVHYLIFFIKICIPINITCPSSK